MTMVENSKKQERNPKKMKIKDFLVGVFSSLILGVLVVWLINYYVGEIKNYRTIKYQNRKETEEQIRFLRDSFQMEYYKMQLDSFYNFNHSRIIDSSKK
jgi:hypothetical protein